MHNYPEGYEKKPWCPNTKLVQICASLAGVELTPQTFCTETINDAHYSGGTIHWLESANFHPAASCAKVNQELIQQLKLAEKVVEAPSYTDTSQKIIDAKDLSAQLKIFRSYEKVMDEYEKRKTIIDRWRKVVFETSVSTTADEKNEHFRRFKSADELLEDEVVGKVKQFMESLEKIIGFEKETIGWWRGEVKNCPQAPKSRHYGPYH